MSPSVFLVAGEASSDMHAANLISALKKHWPELAVFGVGGEALKHHKMEIIATSSEVNVVGVTDWLRELYKVVSAYLRVSRAVKKRKPDLAILLDLPDFNLMLAKKLHRLNVPVIYYVPPQAWAWRKYRAEKMKRFVDLVLCIFKFEEKFYRSKEVPVQFVGHPLAKRISRKERGRAASDILENPSIALLPGSRASELRYHVPILKSVITMLLDKYPGARITIPVASTLSQAEVRKTFSDSRLHLTDDSSISVFKDADVALVATGTATLEAGLCGIPFAAFYRMSIISAWFGRNVFGYKGFLALPNVVCGREVVKEFIQSDCTAQKLFEECDSLIQNELYRETRQRDLKQFQLELGSDDGVEQAAKAITEFLDGENVTFDKAAPA